MAGRHSQKHQLLKRLAFLWALEQRFRVAAIDVRVPRLGTRIDVAACRMEPPRSGRGKLAVRAGPTVVFECKHERRDFLKDAADEDQLKSRLRDLHDQRSVLEAAMRTEFPTLREGETLFPEYDVYRFRDAGRQPYDDLLNEIEGLTLQLHARTKFSKIALLKNANLHYLVADPAVALPHEIPTGWGLLEREGSGLRLVLKAEWRNAPDSNRWNLMQRIALSASAALCSHLGGGAQGLLFP